jgi:hypothetical protein
MACQDTLGSRGAGSAAIRHGWSAVESHMLTPRRIRYWLQEAQAIVAEAQKVGFDRRKYDYYMPQLRNEVAWLSREQVPRAPAHGCHAAFLAARADHEVSPHLAMGSPVRGIADSSIDIRQSVPQIHPTMP